jgi:hypothetical protein
MDRPLLLIDVDGVISLFGFDPARPPDGRFEMVDGIAHYLSARAGEHLRVLSEQFELAWCTGWEEKANEYLPLALGLPADLSHVIFEGRERPPGAHWKLAAIDAHVGPLRPLAWIDDGHDDRCTAWALARSAPTLLVATEPSEGITAEHVARLRAWAAQLPTSPRTSRAARIRP